MNCSTDIHIIKHNNPCAKRFGVIFNKQQVNGVDLVSILGLGGIKKQ